MLCLYASLLALVFGRVNLESIDCDDGSSASTTTADPLREPPFVTARAPLRDGVNVTLDYFLPSSEGRFPAIIEITPYGRGLTSPNFRNEASYWIEHEYVFVIADTRGTGDSEGDFIFSAKEGPDAYDLIEWIARQPWSNGRVGMRGASYSGANQWAAAREQPPHLSCITPSATPARPMNEVPYDNGVFSLRWAFGWISSTLNIVQPPIGQPNRDVKAWLKYRPLRTLDSYAVGRELALYREMLDHPTFDDYWRATDFSPDDFQQITIPTLAFTGWFDSTLKGTIEHFQSVQKSSPRRGAHFMFIGPYMHSNAVDGGYDYLTGDPTLFIGDFPISENGLLPAKEMTRSFYDWCLKDQQQPDFQPVKMFVTGSDRWMTRETFPPPESRQRSLYVTSNGRANGINGDGRLQWDLPSITMTDRYRYDPSDPVIIDMDKRPYDLPIDVNPILDRQDVLVYTTDTLTEALTVVGDVSFDLYVTTSARDTDFIMELMDVLPDGRSIKLGSRVSAQLRLRYRNGFEREILATPGTMYQIKTELGAIGHTFLPGHRIRFALTSSLFPWFSANPNTGNPIATDMQPPIIANQTIIHSPSQPSCVHLMVIDKPTFD